MNNKQSKKTSLWKSGLLEQVARLKASKNTTLPTDVIMQTLKLFKHIKSKQEQKTKDQEINLSSSSSEYSDNGEDNEIESIHSVWDESLPQLNGYHNVDSMSLFSIYKLRSLCCQDWASDQTINDNFFLLAKLFDEVRVKKQLKQDKQKKGGNNSNNRAPNEAESKRNGVLGQLTKVVANDCIYEEFQIEDVNLIRDNEQSSNYLRFKRFLLDCVESEQYKQRDVNYCRYHNPKRKNNKDKLSILSTVNVVKKKFLMDQLKTDDQFSKSDQENTQHENSDSPSKDKTLTFSNNLFTRFFDTNKYQEEDDLELKHFNSAPLSQLQSQTTPLQSSPLRQQFRNLINLRPPILDQNSICIQPSQTLSSSPLKHRRVSNSRGSAGQSNNSNKRNESLGNLLQNFPPSSSKLPTEQDEEYESSLLKYSQIHLENSNNHNSNNSSKTLQISILPKSCRFRSLFDFNNSQLMNENQSHHMSSRVSKCNGTESNFWIKDPGNNYSGTTTKTLKCIPNRSRINSVQSFLESTKLNTASFKSSKTFSSSRKPPTFVPSNLFSPFNTQGQFLPKIQHSDSKTMRSSQTFFKEQFPIYPHPERQKMNNSNKQELINTRQYNNMQQQQQQQQQFPQDSIVPQLYQMLNI